MQTISELKNSDISLKIKKDSFSDKLESESFFLLIKPAKNIYINPQRKELIEKEIELLIQAGFKNIEISWSENKNWLDYVSKLISTELNEFI